MSDKPKKPWIADLILDLLDDGKPHHRDELRGLIAPSDPQAIYFHLTRARKKLPEDHQIVCRFIHRQLWYQRVIVYSPSKAKPRNT